jgi:hypothetical protein
MVLLVQMTVTVPRPVRSVLIVASVVLIPTTLVQPLVLPLMIVLQTLVSALMVFSTCVFASMLSVYLHLEVVAMTVIPALEIMSALPQAPSAWIVVSAVLIRPTLEQRLAPQLMIAQPMSTFA